VLTILQTCSKIVDYLDKQKGRMLSLEEKYNLAAMGNVQALWKFYKAGAKTVGISVLHVVKQFDAE
jgi:ATP-dependent RNA circularization protein (DNA/RNA ligase family)